MKKFNSLGRVIIGVFSSNNRNITNSEKRKVEQ